MFASLTSGRIRALRPHHGALLLALVAALAAVSALPRVARAVTKINDVRVAGEPDGEGAGEAFTAGSGSQSVYVLFDYTGATRSTRVAVEIVGSSLELFREEERYEGDGTATVEITGDAIYANIAESLVDTAAVLLASSNQVQRANISAGQLDNDLNIMVGRVNAGSIAVPLLLTLEDETLRDSIRDLDAVLVLLSESLDDARAYPYDDVEGRQVALESTADDARELERLAQDIAEGLEGSSDLALPTMGPQWSYDVSVRVTEGSQQDVPAGDALFYVVEQVGGGGDVNVGGNDTKASATATRRPLIGQGSSARSTRTPPPDATARPTADSDDDAGDRGGAEDDEAGAADDDSGAASAGEAGIRASATPRPGAQASATPVASGGDDAEAETSPVRTEGSGADEDGAVTGAEADALAAGAGTAVAEAGGEASAPPTWTPAAGVAGDADAAADGDEAAADGGSGPNRAVLLLGVLVLVGAGLWFRSRL